MSYRIYGSSGSPYSVKVRSYFRYKDIDHVWLVQNTAERRKEHAKFSKLPIVPTVVTPDGKGIQDSTPIIETMEAMLPEPSIHPKDPMLRFLSELLEEFGDEWGNKWMMHFRWYSSTSAADAEAYARRVATEMCSGAPVRGSITREQLGTFAATFKERMLGRGFTVGSNEHTGPIIEDSFLETISLLEAHLAERPYLFGRSPSLADFGLAGQLYQCLQDVTCGELMRLHAPQVALWAERMANPKAVLGGGFDAWPALSGTLEPLLKSQVALFLQWSAANARALAAGDKELTIQLGGGRLWKQSIGGPQRYHGKSLAELRRKFQAAAGVQGLQELLRRCGCLEYLLEQAGPPAKL